MKILWHSNAPWSNTGYGTQTRHFTPRIRNLGHDVAISAYWGLGAAVFTWEGLTVFPGDEAWGNRLLPALARHYEADLVITLMDVWVLTSKALSELPLACWVPVDHEPCPPRVVDFFKRTGAKPIAMSRFGERMLRDAGLSPLYAPHGVETSVYRPRPEKRTQTRARMHVPDDAFVVGMVAANKGNNPPRKAFPQVFRAFANLREKHQDAYLYLHCDPAGQQGLNLPELAELVGIPDEAIRFTTPLQLELGINDHDMVDLFSAFDVLANPSYGEGFGIPIVEAQSCGVPVVVTDCTAMSELVGDGWAVKGEPWFDPQQKAFFTAPSVGELTSAFEEAYEDRGKGPSEAAREFALDYDVDRVLKKYWQPALAALGAPSLRR